MSEFGAGWIVRRLKGHRRGRRKGTDRSSQVSVGQDRDRHQSGGQPERVSEGQGGGACARRCWLLLLLLPLMAACVGVCVCVGLSAAAVAVPLFFPHVGGETGRRPRRKKTETERAQTPAPIWLGQPSLSVSNLVGISLRRQQDSSTAAVAHRPSCVSQFSLTRSHVPREISWPSQIKLSREAAWPGANSHSIVENVARVREIVSSSDHTGKRKGTVPCFLLCCHVGGKGRQARPSWRDPGEVGCG